MSDKKIAILQSNYIPWKGYFDLIAAVDEFILYDEVQFTKNDWRNRNRIKTPQGVQWLTVPVGQNIGRRICEVTLDSKWQAKHWKSLEGNYRRAPYFSDVAVWLEPLYLNTYYSHLSQLNHRLITAVCSFLKIETIISKSTDYRLGEGRNERLVELCIQSGGREYVSGPSAKSYIDESLFDNANIKLTWFNYPKYPEYLQLWGEFANEVSVLDLLFNCGPDARRYMNQSA